MVIFSFIIGLIFILFLTVTIYLLCTFAYPSFIDSVKRHCYNKNYPAAVLESLGMFSLSILIWFGLPYVSYILLTIIS